MESYIERVQRTRELVTKDPAQFLADWQGFAWRLTSAFAEAMTFGQCIAVLNAVIYR